MKIKKDDAKKKASAVNAFDFFGQMYPTNFWIYKIFLEIYLKKKEQYC